MPLDLNLIPYPRGVHEGKGVYRPQARQYIRLSGREPAELRAASAVVQRAVLESTMIEWTPIAGDGGPGTDIAVTLAVNPAVARPQGYRLTVEADGIEITGHDAAGAFYGAKTLAQLLRAFPNGVPAVRIEDWPDFPARGVMLDISRDKVPTMETLYALVDLLAELKINELQLYTEHTFAYRAHPEVWAEASPMTGEDILALDAYCRDRFIDLVPNQNSFGHMERWLKHPRYNGLAEAPDGFEFPWGERRSGPFSLCPGDPGSLQLIVSLYDELLPHFTSRIFNVGCDETFDLGQGKSKAEVEKRGRERVYLDFLLKVYELVKVRGRVMQFWGDIILHRPELIPELPNDVIALEWGYEADHPFDKDGRLFHEAGIPFYVCPGTSSWNTIAGRTDNALGNLRSAASNGLKHGAIGYLNTDWGDNGHWQYLPISYLGFAAGAAFSWCYESNKDRAMADALSKHVFRDRAGVMGQVAYDLGNVYQACGKLVGNASALFHILHYADGEADVMKGLTKQGLDLAEQAIDAAILRLDSARMDRPDTALVADEFRNAAAMLRLACRIGRYRLKAKSESAPELAAELRRILGEHRRLWLARNRPGGLEDSTKALEARLEEVGS